MKVNFLIIFTIMLIVLNLSACGKKGTPLSYENGNYPKQYPSN